MGAMSACIGMINSRSIPDNQFNFDSETNFTLGEKRKRFRLQQRSNSQIFVPIKKEEEFLILSSNEDSNKINIDEKIGDNNNKKQIEKIMNNNYILNNKEKKIKLRGKSNVCIKKKVLNISEESEDIIDCEDEFDDNNHIADSIKNADGLNGKRINYLPVLNPSSSNLNNIKIIKQENGKEEDNEIENNNGILNDSYNNKDFNMELSISKNRISPNEMQRSTIFGNLINNNEENGGKTLDNENNKESKKEDNKNIDNKNVENKLRVIQDYYEGGITNLKANISNSYKIIKANNISFTDNNKEFNKVKPENKEINNEINNHKNDKGININLKENKKIIPDNTGMNNTIKKPNKSNRKKNNKNIDFNDCKIENNINFNIDNNNSNMNSNNKNNLNNINNINNFNNISSINYDPNNNNFNDVSSTMTYFLSLEKSQRKPASSRLDGKVLSLHKNAHMNYNASYFGKLNNNNYRNSVRVNKYKWKLLPKHKYNTQIYKSLLNIPLLKDGQSLFMNEEDQKNMNLTCKHSNRENNELISEIKKREEQQDKIIKSLENKIKNLEQKIIEDKTKEEENTIKITKLEEYMDKNTKKNKGKKISKEKVNKEKVNKDNSTNNYNTFNVNVSQESQKDVKIKKLEEQLEKVKKNNKLNKTLLKQKDKQIQNLIHSKNKQDEKIKQYEYLKNPKLKHDNFFYNFSTKSNKKINLLEEISNYNSNSISNNIIISNSNTNTNNNNFNESKLSLSEIKNNKNLNITTNMKANQFYNKDIILEKDKLKKTHKKENSLIINRDFFKSNTSKFSNSNECDFDNNSKRASLKEVNNLKLGKNLNNKSNTKYNLSTKNTPNISYYNYCNDLTNKTKNNYNTKITLNKMKIYKLNKSSSLTLNSDSRINKYLKQSKVGTKQIIKDENELEMNIVPNTTKTERKKFSFKKSKKILKKGSERDFGEVYLREGSVKNEESNSNNNNSNNIFDNNEIKLFNYNDILNQKANFSNSKFNTTVTNKNINENYISLSPALSPSNDTNKSKNIDNISLENKLNLSQSINNIHITNPYSKSKSNEFNEDINKIYQDYWNEGYLRYKQLSENLKNTNNNISNIDKNLLRLNICMANEIYEIFVDKEEIFSDIKNKFFELFFKKKIYGETEKKYINENIIFLIKDGIIDINKNINENNLKNNEVIIPVLKDIS